MYFRLFWFLFEKRDCPVNCQSVWYDRRGKGKESPDFRLEEKSVSKASHLLTRVRTFLYSFPLSRYFLMKPWRDNDGILGIKRCYLGNFNHWGKTIFFCHQLLPGNRWGLPQVFPMCVCVERVQIRVCIEEPQGYFINLHGESFLFLPDKTLSALSLMQAARFALDFCPVIIQSCREPCRASPTQREPVWG